MVSMPAPSPEAVWRAPLGLPGWEVPGWRGGRFGLLDSDDRLICKLQNFNWSNPRLSIKILESSIKSTKSRMEGENGGLELVPSLEQVQERQRQALGPIEGGWLDLLWLETLEGGLSSDLQWRVWVRITLEITLKWTSRSRSRKPHCLTHWTRSLRPCWHRWAHSALCARWQECSGRSGLRLLRLAQWSVSATLWFLILWS